MWLHDAQCSLKHNRLDWTWFGFVIRFDLISGVCFIARVALREHTPWHILWVRLQLYKTTLINKCTPYSNIWTQHQTYNLMGHQIGCLGRGVKHTFQWACYGHSTRVCETHALHTCEPGTMHKYHQLPFNMYSVYLVIMAVCNHWMQSPFLSSAPSITNGPWYTMFSKAQPFVFYLVWFFNLVWC